MSSIRILILSLMCISLASCLNSQKDMDVLVVKARQNPGKVQQAIEHCTRQVGYAHPEYRRQMAAYIRVPVEQAPAKFCGRLIRAIADGRMTYAELVETNQIWRPKVIAILRGQ